MAAMTLNDRLFAKKGEAAPAGIPVRDPAAKLGEGAASPLSFLIQRRRGDAGPQAAFPAPGSPTAALSKPAPSPPTASALASPGPASAGLASPGPGAASPTKAAALPEPAARHLVEVPLPPVPARSEAANRSAPAGTLEGDDEPDWRRVSFRLGAESHRQLRNIARLWGVSIQGLLQKAVVNFLDAAVTGDDPRWRH
jgi:hypothetical protein